MEVEWECPGSRVAVQESLEVEDASKHCGSSCPFKVGTGTRFSVAVPGFNHIGKRDTSILHQDFRSVTPSVPVRHNTPPGVRESDPKQRSKSMGPG